MATSITDSWHPRFHITPPSAWCNDPNGIIRWGDTYHVFYQYNPHGSFHGSIHWGHATSTNLIHWRNCPIALAPDTEYDGDGVWSGCAVDADGTPTILYTGALPEVQCVATSDQSLEHWTKLANNPVIATPPPDQASCTGFRDPFAFTYGETRYVVIGSGLRNQGGVVLLYRTTDYRSFEFAGIMCSGVPDLGDMWECPNVARVGDGWVLAISTRLQVFGLEGSFDGAILTHGDPFRLDHGDCFYASNTLTEDDGRVLMWGWIRELTSKDEQRGRGWSGALSLPREIIRRVDGTIGTRPAAELAGLRGVRICDSGDDDRAVSGRHFELHAHSSKAVFPIRLRLLDTGATDDHLEVTLCPATDTIEIVHGGAQTLSNGSAQASACSLRGALCRESVDLRIFVDGSIVEIFVNDEVCCSTRAYPTGDATPRTFFVDPDPSLVWEAWEMA